MEPVDLRQAPADIVALSFTDSDLAGLAAAWKAEAESLPSMRLASLRDLRHPMSVDLWIEKTAEHAKLILIRILGGADRWRYGVDELARMARRHGVKLVLLPGECSERRRKEDHGCVVPLGKAIARGGSARPRAEARTSRDRPRSSCLRPTSATDAERTERLTYVRHERLTAW